MSRANPRFRRSNAPLPLAIGPVWLLSAVGILDQQTTVCTFPLMSQTNAFSASSESNILTTWDAAFRTLFLACCSNDFVLNYLKVQCVSIPSRSPLSRYYAGAGAPGTGGANHLPTIDAGIVTRYTSVKGQHGRGRFYIPAVPVGFVTPGNDANRLNAGGQTAYNALAVAYTNTILDGATNVAHCIYTRVPKGGAVTNAVNVTLVNTRTILGTIRRRRLGRGK